MFEGPIVAAYELTAADALDTPEGVASEPFVGIALALPFSMAIWAVVLGVARIWF